MNDDGILKDFLGWILCGLGIHSYYKTLDAPNRRVRQCRRCGHIEDILIDMND